MSVVGTRPIPRSRMSYAELTRLRLAPRPLPLESDQSTPKFKATPQQVRESERAKAQDRRQKEKMDRARARGIAHRHGKKTIACIFCGKPFTPEHSNQRTCSEICSTRNKQRKLEEHRQKQNKGMDRERRTCPVCTFRFQPKAWNQVYCSADCNPKKYPKARR